MLDRLETDRLILRRWHDADRDAFAVLNADARVMRYFKAPLNRAESDLFMDRIEQVFDLNGYGFWAVEDKESGQLAGLTGLAPVLFQAPFVPAVEIGWRMAPAFWGRGYAPEAARAALAAGFGALGMAEIVAFTTAENANSRRVMDKLGMTYDPADDFLHPNLAEDHPLRPHVLYRIKKSV